MNSTRRNTTHMTIIEGANISLIVPNKIMHQGDGLIEKLKFIRIITKRKMIMDRIMCLDAEDNSSITHAIRITNNKSNNSNNIIMRNKNMNMKSMTNNNKVDKEEVEVIRGKEEGVVDNQDEIIEDSPDIVEEEPGIIKIRKKTMKKNIMRISSSNPSNPNNNNNKWKKRNKISKS